MVKSGCLAVCLSWFATSSFSETFTVLAWNVAGAERDAVAVADSVSNMIDDLGSAQVLILQEVISQEQVEAVASAVDMNHWVISDFSPPPSVTGTPFGSLEVAIISERPIIHAAEWDTTGQAENGDNFPPRPSSVGTLTEELGLDIGLNASPRRGFLSATLEGGAVVYAVHWKSSRGQSCNQEDLDNALQREDKARGLSIDAREMIQDGHSVIVGGDFNIQAPGRALRVGTTVQEDCNPNGSCDGVCGAGGLDGYDDSISILMDLPDARILSGELDATFIGFATDSGAIDHLLVAGPHASRYGEATAPTVTGDDYFGSDHRPVVASMDTGRSSDPDARIEVLLEEIEDRMEEIRQILGE